MKITESKLRQMIRGVIREFTSGATAAGAKKGGHQSSTRKAAQSDYDTKSADYDTKKAALDAFADKRFRKTDGAGGWDFFSDQGGKGSGRGTNPVWAAKNSAEIDAERNRDSASTTLDTEKAADLEKTVPKQKPPSGGGAGFGKGKSAGKAKGKKKN